MSQGESTVVCDANVSIPGVVSAKVEEERERETQVAKMNCRQTDRVESITGLCLLGTSVFVVHVDLRCWQHYSASLSVLW